MKYYSGRQHDVVLPLTHSLPEDIPTQLNQLVSTHALIVIYSENVFAPSSIEAGFDDGLVNRRERGFKLLEARMMRVDERVTPEMELLQ